MMIARDYFEDLVLVGPKGSLRVLPAGRNTIVRSESHSSYDGHTCGLIPMGGWICEHVTTTGLKWDLDDSTMQFGQLVSSSNRMLSNSVTVDSPYPLIWSLSVHWEFDRDYFSLLEQF